jgi:hypothetical protein
MSYVLVGLGKLMLRNRLIEENDFTVLCDSLSQDEYHRGTEPDFFYEFGTQCLVYEDDHGPICFVKGTPIVFNECLIIRLDIQYVNNSDAKRNLKAMVIGFPELERLARENGVAGFFFESNSPALRQFCTKRLGFQEFGEEILFKTLDKTTEEC